MIDQEILRRLDLIQGTLQLAFAPQLEAAAEAIREDDVNKAILDVTTTEWMSSTELQSKVAAKARVSDRSVRDRFPDLVAKRVLEERGTERRREYRRTGLI
jgi:hypothetical protein